MASIAPVLLTAFRKNRLAIEGAAIVLLAGLGFFALHTLLEDVRMRDIRGAFHAIALWQVFAALSLTVISYLMLTFYDVLALRIVGRPLPYRTAALASFTSYTLSHNFGFALLTGGSARYSIYSAAGLDTADIVRVIAAASAAFWSGIFFLAAVALLFHSGPISLGVVTMSPFVQKSLAISVIVAGLAIIVALGRSSGNIHILRWRLPHPDPRQAIAQIMISTADLAAASAALFVLVPGASAHLFPLFFLAYAIAVIVALVSHVPGGVGVFEAVILAILPQTGEPVLLAALIMYRLIYYLLPLAVAAILLVFHQRRQLRKPAVAALGAAQFVLRGIAPTFLSALVFIGGCVLLVSGSLPAVPHRLHLLRDLVPLPFVEASHIAASLAGTGLLILAPALYRRLDAAFILCRALLLAGAVFSLAKGFDYEEAIILSVIAGLLQLARPAFYRHTTLTTALGSAQSIWMIAIAAGLATWIGFFAYRHVDYQSDLWWQFAWKGDASRFLRASFAIAVALTGFAVSRLFGHTEPPAERDDGDGFELAFLHSKRTDAMLALTGDKRVLWSASGNTMLLYQVQGRSWIVMGDPIGPREEWADLLWTIRERADAAQGRLLLYQISMEAVPVAIDLGLQLVKYGEEAHVLLDIFSLEGPEMKSLRHASRRAEREGATFEIVDRYEIPPIIGELRAISDEWLKAKKQSEKAFSVGRFDPRYLAHFDVAIVREQGRIVAFANLWSTADREELSVDLMRHADVLPYGTMDFLFVRLMLWGKAQGYRRFNLGLAPLSGLEARRLAPIWARAGAFLFRHGEALYGFEGLRAYKDKFGPVWEPRYIAGPHGVGLGRGLIDLQTLISGSGKSAARQTGLSLVA